MHSLNLRSYCGLGVLAFGVVLLRHDQATLLGLFLSAILVIIFWYLNGLSFALSNLRNILRLSLIFLLALNLVWMIFPTSGQTAKMGLLSGSDLNPARIARLKESHEIALELYFDHRPTLTERYFKVGSLGFTQDGMHYTSQRTPLDRTKLQKTIAWVQENFQSQLLSDDLAKLQSWLKDSFTYSLTPGVLRNTTPLDDFLFESRTGFCEHYAAAVATLLTLGRFKTQVIVGYVGGSWNPLLRRLTYQESDAHAWVEVLNPLTKQWQLVDPTAWVRPTNSQAQSIQINPWLIVLGVLGGLAVVVFLLPIRTEPISTLLDKLSAIEKKHHLQSTGLTISERISRIASLYPKKTDALLCSLSSYHDCYYSQEPTTAVKKQLSQSILKWSKL